MTEVCNAKGCSVEFTYAVGPDLAAHVAEHEGRSVQKDTVVEFPFLA